MSFLSFLFHLSASSCFVACVRLVGKFCPVLKCIVSFSNCRGTQRRRASDRLEFEFLFLLFLFVIKVKGKMAETLLI